MTKNFQTVSVRQIIGEFPRYCFFQPRDTLKSVKYNELWHVINIEVSSLTYHFQTQEVRRPHGVVGGLTIRFPAHRHRSVQTPCQVSWCAIEVLLPQTCENQLEDARTWVALGFSCFSSFSPLFSTWSLAPPFKGWKEPLDWRCSCFLLVEVKLVSPNRSFDKKLG